MTMPETEVRERGILFSDRLVRAILDGRKTETRRIVKPQPEHRLVEPRVGLTVGMDPADDGAVWYDADGIGPGREVRCPYGSPLDRLYVREAWQAVEKGPPEVDGEPVGLYIADRPLPGMSVVYRATDDDGLSEQGFRWRPSIHMPKWASRIWLEIADVRVERVQEITEADARAEGVIAPLRYVGAYRAEFSKLWDEINGPRGYGWEGNPWVWVIEFRRIER